VTMLEGSKPPTEWVNLVQLRESLLAYTRGMAALQTGDAAGAAKFSEALQELVKEKPADAAKPAAGSMAAMPGMHGGAPTKKDAAAGPVHSYVGLAALELKASVEMAQGKAPESEASRRSTSVP
jgi:hypothetical protein